MRILVTGSRFHRDKDFIREALSRYQGPGTLIHGTADGADRIAAEIAEEFYWKVEAHAPKDRSRAALLARNAEMVASAPDICVAFPLPGSTGTWHTVKLAQAAHIPTVVWTYPKGRRMPTPGRPPAKGL